MGMDSLDSVEMNANEGKQQRSFCSVALIVTLFALVSMVNAEPVGPAPVQVPDIRANIVKMLQERRGVEGADEEDLFAEAERQKREKQQPPAATIKKQEAVAKPEVAPAAKPAPKVESSVELPVKEIVIENMDDLKKLAEELRKAKKRQGGQ
jgi:hypothetical protein